MARVAQRGNWAQWDSRNPRNSGIAFSDGNGQTPRDDANLFGDRAEETKAVEDMARKAKKMNNLVQNKMFSIRERMKSIDEHFDEAQDKVDACGVLGPARKRCEALEKSPGFMFVVALAIIANVVCMSFQADYPNFDLTKDCSMTCMSALDRSTFQRLGCSPDCVGGSSDFWACVNHSFLIFFTVELVIRIFSAGGFFRFCCDTKGDQGWNIFDTWIVTTCWMLWYFQTTNVGGGQYFGMLRSLRMLRMLRVLRIFRVPALKKLNIIVTGLIESFPSGFWVGCMLTGVMFVASIFCTDLLGHEAAAWPPEDQEDIRDWFGSITLSMNTLFTFLTLADWSSITRKVAVRKPWMTYFFLWYVIFAAMVILSLLTGVLADHINTVSCEAEREEAELRLEKKKEALAAEFKAFNRAAGEPGRDGVRRMTRPEFKGMIKDEEIMNELTSQGIEIDEDFDLDDLFNCFDQNSNGVLCFHEFKAGLEELRTGIQATKVFKLEASIRNAVFRCKLKTDPSPLTPYNGRELADAATQEKLAVASGTLASIDETLNSLQEEFEHLPRLPRLPGASPLSCC